MTWQTFATAAAAACILSLVSASGAWAQPKAKGSSFVEHFDRLSKKRWYISDGWANGKHQNCLWSADQVAVTEGSLRLSFARKPSQDRAYACAEIQSRQRFGYGVYEARLKAVAGPGFNTGFFTYIGKVHKQPWHEIDFEILGKDPSQVQLNRFVNGKGGHESFARVPGGADRDYHDYAFVWEPERLRYFVNGVLVETVNAPEKLPSRAMKIYLTLWAGETNPGWMGVFSDPGRPVHASVTRVSYTALGDPCLYPESLVCRLD